MTETTGSISGRVMVKTLKMVLQSVSRFDKSHCDLSHSNNGIKLLCPKAASSHRKMLFGKQVQESQETHIWWSGHHSITEIPLIDWGLLSYLTQSTQQFSMHLDAFPHIMLAHWRAANKAVKLTLSDNRKNASRSGLATHNIWIDNLHRYRGWAKYTVGKQHCTPINVYAIVWTYRRFLPVKYATFDFLAPPDPDAEPPSDMAAAAI